MNAMEFTNDNKKVKKARQAVGYGERPAENKRDGYMSPHIVINRSLSVAFTHMDNIPYPAKKFNRWRKKIVSFFGNTPAEAEIVYTPAKMITATAKIIPTAAEIVHTPAKMIAATAEIVHTREKIVYTAAKIIPTTTKMITTSAKMTPTSAEIIDTTAEIIHARAKIIPTSAEVVPTSAKMTATAAEIVPTTKKIIHTALGTVRKSRGTVSRAVCIVFVVRVNISSAVWIIFDQLEVKNLRQIKIKILIGGIPNVFSNEFNVGAFSKCKAFVNQCVG